MGNQKINPATKLLNDFDDRAIPRSQIDLAPAEDGESILFLGIDPECFKTELLISVLQEWDQLFGSYFIISLGRPEKPTQHPLYSLKDLDLNRLREENTIFGVDIFYISIEPPYKFELTLEFNNITGSRVILQIPQLFNIRESTLRTLISSTANHQSETLDQMIKYVADQINLKSDT